MQDVFPSDEQIKNAILKINEKNHTNADPNFFATYSKQIISSNTNRSNEKIYILAKPFSATIIYYGFRQNGEPIGWTQFSTNCNSFTNHRAEISYCIYDEYQGLGFGTLLTEESIKDFMESQPLNNKWSYNGQQLTIDSIEADINLDNLGSQALINKNGFVLESTETSTKNYILTREMYFSRLNNNEQTM
jgi:RimJ/RimL family protein N-acetyltransferase